MARILIVDDMPAMRSMLFRLMEHFGHEAACAQDGAEAFEIMKHAQPPFDLVLTDWEMPRMDGIELCKSIRAHGRFGDTPIIVASSRCDEQDQHEAINAGATAFLPKPFVPDDLDIMIESLLVIAEREKDPPMRCVSKIRHTCHKHNPSCYYEPVEEDD